MLSARIGKTWEIKYPASLQKNNEKYSKYCKKKKKSIEYRTVVLDPGFTLETFR